MGRPRVEPEVETPETPAEAEQRVALERAERELLERAGLPGVSPFTDEQQRMLAEPLDPARVKSRGGRGGGQYSYLETHDVKRTLNRIFGYGGWGHRIVEQVELEAVPVVNDKNDKEGWHVGYRCVVELTVRGAVPTAGSGYGDGVEYGPAARVTACELALKESESDALKRAAVSFGDQFGLILYAKDDDQRRLARDQAADVARAPVAVSIDDAIAKLEQYVGNARPWIKEAVDLFFTVDLQKFQTTLTPQQQTETLRRLIDVMSALEANVRDPFAVAPEALQAAVRTAFAVGWDGLEVLGPEPFQGPVPFG